MNPRLLKIYHRLPPAGRTLVAGLRGWQLRRWRYGDETDALVEEILERERWSPERWRRWQDERLAAVLERARTHVPVYRRIWSERDADWRCLENWPLLKKDAVRADPRRFLAADCDPRHMYPEHTSGTTGKSVELWWSHATVRTWYALTEARWRRWYGVSRHDRWAILGGQLIVPVKNRRPPFWVWNAPLRQLYLSAYHLAPDLVASYLDALKSYRVRYLYGYPSALYPLALEALRRGWREIELEVVVTNAEPLFEHQRQAIAEAFRCPVRETYGVAETCAAASECEAGRLHLWPEAGHLEFADDGEILATTLLNTDMPLVRYRLGDRARPATAGETCPCGRTLPLVESIEGRVDDVVYTCDGRPVGRLDPVFKARLPIREAQIVQESLERLRVLYVPDAEYTPEAGRDLVERLRDRLGPVEVTLEAVAEIPRTKNGKFRAVISRI